LIYVESEKLPYSSHKASAGSYNYVTKIWDIGTLNGGQTVTLDLVLFPLVKGEDLMIKATLTPSDDVPANNTVALSIKNAISARSEAPRGFGIQNVYPNPPENVLTIALHSETNGALQLHIFDTFGRLIQKTTQNVAKGTETLSVSVENLPEGMYILQLSDTNNRMTVKKFIK
jgi:Secretion system C-terminal sorting domain/Domain of unknown function DUF11